MALALTFQWCGHSDQVVACGRKGSIQGFHQLLPLFSYSLFLENDFLILNKMVYSVSFKTVSAAHCI